jgi:hypothetical protein
MFILLKKKSDKTITCNDCKFFNNDPKILEYLFPGILVLSPFYSSSRGDAGICEYHDLFLLPGIIYEQSKSKSIQSLLDTSQNNSHIKLPYPLMRNDQQGLSSGKSVIKPQASQGQDSGSSYA